MTDTPPDWVLIEAAKRCEWADARTLDTLQRFYSQAPSPYRALCDMIAKHEQKPLDRKLLCAREAMAGTVLFEPVAIEGIVSRAITLWEEGFGK